MPKKLILFITSIVCLWGVNAFALDEAPKLKVKVAEGTCVDFKIDSGYKIMIDGVDSLRIISDAEIFTAEKSGDLILVTDSQKNCIGVGSDIYIQQDSPTYVHTLKAGSHGGALTSYADNMIIRLSGDKTKLLTINEVEIEHYLRGVLPYEMSSKFELEALKAQAVCARSYAIANINKHAKDGYSVCNTTHCQVYKGYSDTYYSYQSVINSAVLETEGQVLMCNGKIVPAYFSASNGGYTADAAFVWNSKLPYISSKKDMFDMDYKWKQEYSCDEVWKKLSPRDAKIGKISDMNIVSKTNGYVTELKITDKSGYSMNLKRDATRFALSLKSMVYNISKIRAVFVKSLTGIFEVKKSAYVRTSTGVKLINLDRCYIKSSSTVTQAPIVAFEFTGQGYGHGIGLSQLGANARAKAGQSYTQILDFYYDNIEIASNYNR